MRRSTPWMVFAGGLAAVALLVPAGPLARVGAQDRQADGGDHASESRALFSAQCASCHVTPDPRVATDRAFIRQLQETA